jgi:hypothetical protein
VNKKPKDSWQEHTAGAGKKQNFLLLPRAPAVLALLLFVSLGVSQEKPWAEWTRAEAEKILNNSAWGQTQTETDTSEMVYTPTTQGATTGSTRSENIRGVTDRQAINNNRITQGATNQAISVNYHVRLLSAKPVRQAFLRFMELTRKDLDRETLKGLRSFVERDFSEYIAVAVTFDSTDGRYSGPALQAFGSATLGTLKNRTYLERKDGKRLFLMDYYAPMNDGLGAKFIFPRLVDERNFLNADSGSFRFFSEVGNQIKLNVTFKMSDLVYNGQLEY